MKRIRRLLLLAVCLLALCTVVCAADASITEMKTDCTLTGSGSCSVTQTFTVQISGAQTQLLFPLVPGAKRASVAGYNAQKQTDGDCPVLVLTDNAGFTGSRTFTVQYTVSNLASEADGVQTLRLPLLGAKWAYPIEKYQFTVTMPKPFDAYPAFSSGYYGDVISDYMDLNVSESLISGVIATGLKDHESLEMTLSLEKNYFSGAYTSLSFSWVGMAVIVLLLALAFGYWFAALRSEPIRSGTRILPPDTAAPCDLPFLLCGAPIPFNMLVCHWASLGYLTIFCSKSGHVTLTRRVYMGNERRPAEVRLFEHLFSQGDVCEGASLLYKRTAEAADTMLRRYWTRKLYRRSGGNPLICRALAIAAGALAAAEAMSPLLPAGFVRWVLLILIFVLGGVLSGVILYAPSAYCLGRKPMVAAAAVSAIVLLVAANLGEGLLAVLFVIVCLLAVGMLTMHGGRRTNFGTEVITQAMGYRRFLLRVTQKHLLGRMQKDGQYFYKILPYAESIGLGAHVARALGDAELEQCDWYQESEPLPRTAAGFYSHLREALALLELSIRN